MINSIGARLPIEPPKPSPVTGTQPSTFVDALKSAVDHVEISKQAASRSVDAFLDGDTEDIHAVGMAVQRAELEFDMAMQVRNKVVQAYQEIMRMPL